MSNNEKQFISGLFVDEFTFQDGGSVIKLTLTDAMIKYYEENKTVNSKGNNHLKIDLKRAKESQKLYAELNTYVPKTSEAPAEPVGDDLDMDIPF